MKKNGTSRFGFIAATLAQCNLPPLESYPSRPLIMQPLNLENHALAHFISFKSYFHLSCMKGLDSIPAVNFIQDYRITRGSH